MRRRRVEGGVAASQGTVETVNQRERSRFSNSSNHCCLGSLSCFTNNHRKKRTTSKNSRERRCPLSQTVGLRCPLTLYPFPAWTTTWIFPDPCTLKVSFPLSVVRIYVIVAVNASTSRGSSLPLNQRDPCHVSALKRRSISPGFLQTSQRVRALPGTVRTWLNIFLGLKVVSLNPPAAALAPVRPVSFSRLGRSVVCCMWVVYIYTPLIKK